jgi:hypothetical protein
MPLAPAVVIAKSLYTQLSRLYYFSLCHSSRKVAETPPLQRRAVASVEAAPESR